MHSFSHSDMKQVLKDCNSVTMKCVGFKQATISSVALQLITLVYN